TTNQALCSGVPVLGIPQNMDQFLNMEAIVAFGAGSMIRADRAQPFLLRQAIKSLISDPKFAVRAQALADSLELESASSKLAGHIMAQLNQTTVRNM
ncbi:glycosyltransferase, partial [Dechloromonas denitrificans]